jgi:hypothetical protein
MTSENLQIVDKVKILFDYRKIHWLLAESRIPNQTDFLERLINLQIAMYELDWQLENQWNIELPDLKSFWLNIYSRLAEMGLSENQQRTWTKEIVRYQTRELELRQGITPLKHSMEDLYNFKSCDVRLMRRLIYREDVSLNSVLRFSDWLEFDLITEVNDDIEDLLEDLVAFNANRFLFSLYEHGSMATHELFEVFIKEKSNCIWQRLQTSDTKGRQQMKIWIDEIVNDTLVLLQDRVKSLMTDQIRASDVITHFVKSKAASSSSC